MSSAVKADTTALSVQAAVDHVLAYLQDHAAEYALNMDRVVLMGGSATGASTPSSTAT